LELTLGEMAAISPLPFWNFVHDTRF